MTFPLFGQVKEGVEAVADLCAELGVAIFIGNISQILQTVVADVELMFCVVVVLQEEDRRLEYLVRKSL